MENLYAEIIIDISHEALDRVFGYKVPFSLREHIRVGQQVAVPFGRGNKERKGFVVGLSDSVDYDERKVKEILRIEADKVTAESKMLALAYWIRENYGSTIIQALRTVLPVQEKIGRKSDRWIELKIDPVHGPALLDEYFGRHYTAKARLLAALLDQKKISWEQASKGLKISKSTVDAMIKEDVIRVVTEYYYRNPNPERAVVENPVPLNEEQQALIEQFKEDLLADRRQTYLLHGVTGSGKTEVYLAAIEEVIRRGQQAIVLIPEIALTYQTVQRFTRRFGNRVSILNSRLSKGEKYDQWLRAKEGDVDVIIGPRSALFVPFPNLGLIVIDEEHEGSYKSEQTPKYHARETAIQKAKMEHASVILGSATPSVESYRNALEGTYQLWELTKRAKDALLPKVYIEDLRKELQSGNRSIFSRRLHKLMEDRLAKGEQIMLFLNRRGYAGFVSCRSCGHVMECPHCDVSMTYHREGRLKCHYCGHEQLMPKTCPECGSPLIGTFGLGTQKAEAAIHKEFPEARVLRMDMDTTRRKHSHEEILKAFSKGEADILLGTQMIVKGHDYANVTLVGILAADLSLHANDYRAGERTFQLLTQAAGRAGRGRKSGEVVIQTYSPQNYSIQAAASQDYQEFYRQEIGYRTLMKYPPIWQMLVIFLTGEEEKKVGDCSRKAADMLKNKGFLVVGPGEATVAKVKDQYRQVIYIKDEEYQNLVRAKDEMEQWFEKQDEKRIFIYFDFNPMNSY
ncbi:MAG TPA: primosomal protein N' [Candidatus Anaerostipes excrementavium]|uniref:Replication restart protein PriA n=1 Tax=Candidatus Anaerostipes excrementavium TaxID=2838463 RepID=A0A9D2B8X3_9FIRM|nr:primosomal protein N' [uncultured Anaerostipes sp.]HIX66539.1 primosomal protein N' [Candidatus Anaerostipes excrementavium]